MYRPVKTNGDTVAVPQLLFTRLSAGGGAHEESRFRVALYVLGEGGAEAAKVARALRLKPAEVDAALSYWEGAGLLERDAAALEAEAPAALAAPVPTARSYMTTREVVKAGEADPTLGVLLGELQRVFGSVIGKGDTSVFVTLYVQDGFAPDLILTAASESAKRGVTRAKYVEKMLREWRKQGLDDCAKADRHLKLMAEREGREAEVATAMGFAAKDPFTLAEKKKIAQWFEEYGYGMEMVDAARRAAGDHQNDVKYLAAILKKWYAKRYKSPRDLQQGDESRNLRVTRAAGTRSPGTRGGKAAGADLLAGAADYVPMKRRGTE